MTESDDTNGPAAEVSSEDCPHLTLLIPAYNEALRITASLREMDAYLAGRPYTSEILIVDDGSQDETSAVARESAMALSTPVRFLGYTPNRGKGYALKVGFEAARGEQILFTDSDLSTPIREVDRLLERSESVNRIRSPRAASKPTFSAYPFPRFGVYPRNRTGVERAMADSRATAEVSSWLPSSTITISLV